MAFAFNQAVPMIETNIRTVFLHHFYSNDTDVEERELIALVEDTLDAQNPREWYWALMDYGTYLKKTHGNPNSRSRSYTKQSKFSGSDRQIRGAIIRTLTEVSCTRRGLHKRLTPVEVVRIDAQLERLLAEGLVTRNGQRFALPT